MRSTLRSTTVTRMSGHFNAMTLHVGPPTYPAPMQQIFVTTILWQITFIYRSENSFYVSFDRLTIFLAGIDFLSYITCLAYSLSVSHPIETIPVR